MNLKGKILFIHIPKNAGSSIAKGLGFEITTHIKASEIEESYNVNFFKDKFSFAIVRNPVERFLSLYHYARMEISLYHNNINPSNSLYGKHLDYDILKDASLYECALLLTQNKLLHDKSWNQWEPQYTWIYNKLNEKLIPNVYKIEELKYLEKDIYSKFNINLNLAVLNKSNKLQEINNLDNKTISILKEYYKQDFELFGY